jgi:hypothetical protein
MKTHELLNQPLGAEVSWPDWKLTGRIMDRSDTSITIHRSDGNRAIVSVSDPGIDDLAYELEVIEAALAEPVVVVR